MRGLTPSVIAADFARLGEQLALVEPYAVRWHTDVMDGHYVPNLTIGPMVVEAIAKASRLPQDVHVMISNPGETWEWYAKAGAARIAFHPDAVRDPGDVLAAMRAGGIGPGLALNPDVPASAVVPYLDLLELVVVMTIEPGFSGQELRPELLSKLGEVKELAGGRAIDVVVDGGVTPANAEACVEAGADLLVSASAIFWSDDPEDVARRLAAIAGGASG